MIRFVIMSEKRDFESKETPNGREFHLGNILSITTGRLVSPRHIDGVYDILDYMTGGDSLYTHQLGRAADECKPYLLMEMPWLEEIDTSGVNGDNWESWLQKQVDKYGERHEVRPIHFEDHEIIDPVDELKQMGVDESKIITIETSEEEPLSPFGDIDWKVDEEDLDEGSESDNSGFSLN